MRQSADASAPYYAVLQTPNNGVNIETRTSEGLAASLFTIPTSASNPLPKPLYVKIARAGNLFSTYLSNDGTNWNYVLGSTSELI